MKAQPFYLTGQLLEFVSKGTNKFGQPQVKAICLAVEEQAYWIKVPKDVRQRLDASLSLGCELVVMGKQKYKKTGQVKLKAKSIKVKHPAHHHLKHSEGMNTQCKFPRRVGLKQHITQLQPVARTEMRPNPISSNPIPSNPIPSKPSQQTPPSKILVCQKSSCRKRGGDKVCHALQQELGDRGLTDQVQIQKTGCLKKCKKGPNVVVLPDKTHYTNISDHHIPQLLEKHF